MANITITALTIDGVALPTPAFQGVTCSENKVWSANTGRNTSGDMTGTLLGIKSKLEVKWPPLTMEQYSAIEQAVSVDFASVSYTDAAGGAVTKTMYFGDLTCTQYSWANGIQYVTDASVSMIEK